MTTIMLTGKNGQLGWELQRTLPTLAKVIAFDHHTLDLSDHKLLRNTIRDIKPDLIVNAAAYTAVDQAEKEEGLAIAINANAPEVMAEEAKKLRAMLIHYSTDYVFDGNKKEAYIETDSPSPNNIYGKSKLMGEQAIQNQDIPYYIFRTSWVYAARGQNFLLTMLRLMQERESLNIVDDQFGAPTWSRSIAEITGQVISHNNDKTGLDFDAMRHLSGIYHLTSSGRTSWYEFAKEICHQVSDRNIIKNNFQIQGIPTSQYPTPAKRPVNSELSTSKLNNTFGIVCPDWKDSLSLCIQDLLEEAPAPQA